MGNNWTASGKTTFYGYKWWPETAQQPYDAQLSDTVPQIARFEVRPNELWSGAVGGNDTERAEFDGAAGAIFPIGSTLGFAYSFLLEPGAPQINTSGGYPGGPAAWFIVGQIHGSKAEKTVPLTMKIKTVGTAAASKEYLYFAKETDPEQTEVVLWTDPKPYVRGTVRDIVINATIAGKPTDKVQVFVNGVKVVDHVGIIGTATPDPGFFAKIGIYRGWQGDGLPPVAGQFANVVMGAAPVDPAKRPGWPVKP
jgi:hypothetical protein